VLVEALAAGETCPVGLSALCGLRLGGGGVSGADGTEGALMSAAPPLAVPELAVPAVAGPFGSWDESPPPASPYVARVSTTAEQIKIAKPFPKLDFLFMGKPRPRPKQLQMRDL
jgi:hypothetical protein